MVTDDSNGRGRPRFGGGRHSAPPKAVAKDLVESFVAIDADGGVTVHVGKVDLGTGTRTALAQIAADELDLPFDRVTMVMGHRYTPDQWLTGANLDDRPGLHAELRRACATARAALLARAADRLGVPAAELASADGSVRVRSAPDRRIAYADLSATSHRDEGRCQGSAETGERLPRGRQVDPPGRYPGQAQRRIHLHAGLPAARMLHARVLRPDGGGAPSARLR